MDCPRPGILRAAQTHPLLPCNKSCHLLLQPFPASEYKLDLVWETTSCFRIHGEVTGVISFLSITPCSAHVLWCFSSCTAQEVLVKCSSVCSNSVNNISGCTHRLYKTRYRRENLRPKQSHQHFLPIPPSAKARAPCPSDTTTPSSLFSSSEGAFPMSWGSV